VVEQMDQEQQLRCSVVVNPTPGMVSSAPEPLEVFPLDDHHRGQDPTDELVF
jgi:hypothetical protein